MTRVNSEIELLAKILPHMLEANKDVVIVAGHFPLRVDTASKKLVESVDEWGHFTPYTLELGRDIGIVAALNALVPDYLFLCDDHKYRGEDEGLLAKQPGLNKSQLYNRWRKARNELYNSRSGPDATLHPLLEELLTKDGYVSLDDVLRQKQKKHTRTDCLYWSEMVLRNPDEDKQDDDKQVDLPEGTACHREYVKLLKHPDIQGKYVVGFIPNICSHWIMDAIMMDVPELEHSHIFMDTMNSEKTVEDLYKGEEGATLFQS